MTSTFKIILTVATLALGLALGCTDDELEAGRFPCGDGGSCDAATELCITAADTKCSTCVPLPAACDADPTCTCIPPGTDAAHGAHRCEDAGSCAATGDGLTLTCTPDGWGCG